MRELKSLTSVAMALAVVVIILGAYTRLVDAGLGCPDWPGCYGFLTVPTEHDEIALAEERYPELTFEADKAWPEMVHRYFAAFLGLVIIALPLVAWWRKQSLTLPLVLAVLVVLQGAFGAWTVTMKLWPQVVTTHLLGGFATLTLLWIYGTKLGLIPTWSVTQKVTRHVHWVLVLLVVQIMLGGWTSSNYAALACPDFPLCHGELVPSMDFKAGFNVLQDIGPNYLGGQMTSEARIAIQIVHRIGAVAMLIFCGWLALRLSGYPRMIVGGLLLIQIALGVSNVWFDLPLYVATAHNFFAVLLLLALTSTLMASRDQAPH